jgi:hypothetical protein
MKLLKWIKQVDSICDVIIYSQYDEEEPIFEGAMFEIPWVYMNKEIGRTDGSQEEPIYISHKKLDNGVVLPVIIINIIE